MTTSMESKIGYFARDDGVSIAYATVGNGPPLVQIPGWVSHLDRLWVGPRRAFLERIAQHFRIITFDKHGTGLSDRDRTEFTLQSEVRDLEALVDHLGLETFALWAMSEGGPAAVRYTVDHPERVERLLFYASFANGQTLASDEFKESFIGLVEASWGFASQTMTDLLAPGSDAARAEGLALQLRESASKEVAAGLLRLIYSIDVRDLLPSISTPTLIAHRRGDRMVPIRGGRDLAMGIPGARFAPLDGNQHVAGAGDVDALVHEILDFLLDGDPVTPQRDNLAPAGLQTILFTDLAGSTAMQSRLGDADAHKVLQAHDAAVRTAIGEFNGREVKHTGDGMMAAFGSAADAVSCALQVRRDIETYNDTHDGEELLVRFGLNAGEPIAEDDDLFGLSVTLAARIGDWGEPGQVMVSDVVRQLLLGKGFEFTSMGEAELKGFDEPVAVFEVSAHD